MLDTKLNSSDIAGLKRRQVWYQIDQISFVKTKILNNLMKMQTLKQSLFLKKRSLIFSHDAGVPDVTSFSIACRTPSLSKLFSCTELSFPYPKR